MSKRYKTRAELESKVIRISLGQYALLKEICRRASVTMTEALDLALKRLEPEPKPEPAQIPMISMPVTRATTIPVTRARSTPVTISVSREVEHINGH